MKNHKVNLRIKVNPAIVARKVDNQLIVFDSAKGILHELDEVAAYIYSRLKKKIPANILVEEYKNKYQLSDIKASREISSFIDCLLKKEIFVLDSD